MRKKVQIFLAVMLLVQPVTGYAQEQEATFSWEECVQKTLEKNPEIAKAWSQVRASQYGKNIIRSSKFPQISASASGAQNSSSGEKKDSYSLGVTGKLLLFDGSETTNEVLSKDESLKASEFQHAVVLSNKLYDLKSAYVKLLQAQEMVGLTQEIAKRRLQNLESIQLRYESGREHKGALMTSEADLTQAEFEVDQAERSLDLSQTRLWKVMGDEVGFSLILNDELVSETGLSGRPDFSSMVDETPLLKKLISEKEAVRYDLASTKASYFPKVYFNSSAGTSGSEWFPEDDAWSMGLSVSVPLFEGGKKTNSIKQAQESLNQSVASVSSARDVVIETLHETWNGWQDNIQQVDVKDKYLKAAQERATISDAQYSAGLINYDDWIIIENSLVSSEKAYLNSKANVLIAEAAWLQAKGEILYHE